MSRLRAAATGVLVGTLALAGGFGPAAGASPPESSARCAEPGADNDEIVVWHPFHFGPEAAFLRLIDRYQAEHPEVSVVVEAKGNYSMLLDELRTVPRQEWPDVIVASPSSSLSLYESGLTVGPADCASLAPPPDDLLPVIEATYRIDGELVAWPFSVSTPVLIFNAALIEQAGLDPANPPETLEELRSASDAIVESGVATHGLVVYDQVGVWVIRQFPAQRRELLGTPDNGRGSDPVAELTFATDAVAADFEWLRDGVRDGSFRWIGQNFSGSDDLVRITTDTAEGAYALHTSASLGDLVALLEAGSLPGSELGVAPLPGGRGLVGGGALWLVDSGDSHQVGAAHDLVEFLMSPPSLAHLAASTGYVPARSSAVDEPELVAKWAAWPQLRVAYDQLAATPDDAASAGLLTTGDIALDVIFTRATEDLLFEDRPVPDILADVQERAQGVIDMLAGS